MPIVFSGYVPTLQNSERNPYYEQLEKMKSKVRSQNTVVVVGDFNAKTGYGWREFNNNRVNMVRQHKFQR